MGDDGIGGALHRTGRRVGAGGQGQQHQLDQEQREQVASDHGKGLGIGRNVGPEQGKKKPAQENRAGDLIKGCERPTRCRRGSSSALRGRSRRFSLGRRRFLGRRCRLSSEGPTPELQSLMRISYAVFSWKKKKKKTT